VISAGVFSRLPPVRHAIVGTWSTSACHAARAVTRPGRYSITLAEFSISIIAAKLHGEMIDTLRFLPVHSSTVRVVDPGERGRGSGPPPKIGVEPTLISRV